MTRRLDNWLTSYLEFTAKTEAPRLFHFWVGVSVIGSALRRHVWFDMDIFKWYPSFYIILVAPPGVATKSTTATVGHKLLRKIDGINFGPNSVTWEALLKRFSSIQEPFLIDDTPYTMSAMTVGSGELGSLFKPKKDDGMSEALIELWDGVDAIERETIGRGINRIEAPFLNLIGCTTPSWIAGNMPRDMIGGGFVSRCIFVYKGEKENFITWPKRERQHIHLGTLEEDLTLDLEHMATTLYGPVEATEEAYAWGDEWYRRLWGEEAKSASDDHVKGYLARKQGHLVKTAMILSISRGDSLVIQKHDLELADVMLREVEASYAQVFGRIGMTDLAMLAERVLELIRRAGRIPYAECYYQVHAWLPDPREFAAVLEGLIRSGQIVMDAAGQTDPKRFMLVYSSRP